MKNDSLSTGYPSWLTGILKKRSLLSLRILLELIEVGLRNGEVSANDVTVETTKENCNTIGATFKILHRFGFEHTDRRVVMKAKRKHKRRSDVWEMANPGIAEMYIKHLSREVSLSGEVEEQLTMWRT